MKRQLGLFLFFVCLTTCNHRNAGKLLMVGSAGVLSSPIKPKKLVFTDDSSVSKNINFPKDNNALKCVPVDNEWYVPVLMQAGSISDGEYVSPIESYSLPKLNKLLQDIATHFNSSNEVEIRLKKLSDLRLTVPLLAALFQTVHELHIPAEVQGRRRYLKVIVDNQIITELSDVRRIWDDIAALHYGAGSKEIPAFDKYFNTSGIFENHNFEGKIQPLINVHKIQGLHPSQISFETSIASDGFWPLRLHGKPFLQYSRWTLLAHRLYQKYTEDKQLDASLENSSSQAKVALKRFNSVPDLVGKSEEGQAARDRLVWHLLVDLRNDLKENLEILSNLHLEALQNDLENLDTPSSDLPQMLAEKMQRNITGFIETYRKQLKPLVELEADSRDELSADHEEALGTLYNSVLMRLSYKLSNACDTHLEKSSYTPNPVEKFILGSNRNSLRYKLLRHFFLPHRKPVSVAIHYLSPNAFGFSDYQRELSLSRDAAVEASEDLLHYSCRIRGQPVTSEKVI